MKKSDRLNIEDILALTPLQEGILFHYLQEPASLHYVEQLALTLAGEIRLNRFKKAWAHVIQTNDALRTFFRWEKLEKPAQVVLKQHHLNLGFFDLSILQDDAEKQDRFEKIKEEDRRKKFDLREVPFRVLLCKIADRDYRMVIGNHHILYDGWSTGIILKEFFQAYAALEEGNVLPRPAVKPSFSEFIRWNQTRDRDKQRQFWEDYFQGFTAQPPLPIIIKREIQRPGHESAAKEFPFALEKGIKEKLDDFLKNGLSSPAQGSLNKKQHVTPAAVFYCAWGLLLQKYCDSDDVVFGTTVSGRSAPINGIEHGVGLFINTLPLRVTSTPGESVSDLLLKVNEDLPAREKYENTPLVDIHRYSRREPGQELFDSLLVMENYPLDHFLKGENKTLPLTVRSYSAVESTPYGLNIAITLQDSIAVRLIYSSEDCTGDAIARLSRHFAGILNEIMDHPGSPGHALEILSREEKKQLLLDFNEVGSGFPVDKTLHGLFAEQAGRTPDRVALAGVKEKEQTGKKPFGRINARSEVVSMTYTELDEKSAALARCLLETGVNPGESVGIMVERSLAMIIGILGILKAGCAYVPLNPKAPPERTNYMLSDSNAKNLVTTGNLAVEVEKLRSLESGKNVEILFLDTPSSPSGLIVGFPNFLTSQLPSFPLFPATGHRPPATSPAYLIYTSGSTGKPKGVPISHANFSPLVHWGYRHLGIGPSDRSVQNLSYYFDWSVWEIFIALTSGAGLYMVSGEVVLDAEQYLDFIQRHGITVLHITPTHFQSLLHVSAGRRLKTLKYLCLGAEKLSCDLVGRSYEWVSEECRVFNMYGPTEATIMAAVLEIARVKLSGYKALSSVPIGKNLGNNILLVLDRHLQPCPLEVPGELVIGGDGVALGYLNQPELTCEKFDHDLLGLPAPLPGRRRLYKTGDFARWLSDGTVEFLGRMDQQLKIRGFRIEPGEIEKNLVEHGEVKDTLVTVGEYENGDKYLCAYVVPRPGSSSQLSKTLKEYLSGRLPDYMVPAYFVTLERIPLNPNGKVDLKALPGPVVTAAKGYSAPGNDWERGLVEIWARVLRMDAAVIGIDDDFFRLGGHSLNITAVIGRIHKELKIQVPFIDFFVNPTVRELAAYISQKQEGCFGEILPVEEREYYPLSPAQRRLFVLQQMETACTAYNIHSFLKLERAVAKEKIEDVFKQLIAKHESLRTSFAVINEEPVQRIHKGVKFEIENYALAAGGTENAVHHALPSAKVFAGGTRGAKQAFFQKEPPWPPEAIIKNFIRPFDLAGAPLLRVGFLEPAGGTGTGSGPGHVLLMVDMHHIIADGASIDVLVNDFTALSAGERLPVQWAQYKEFSQWQKSEKERKRIAAQEAYWLKAFSGEIPVLNLPADYLRPVVQDFAGSTLEFEIPVEQSKGLKELALHTKTTLFMVLLAIYNILLSKLSGQEEIVVGTPVAGRRHPALERITGMFVNTVVLRNFPHHRKSFAEFLAEVKQQTLEAFENQDYPYEALVDALVVKRNTNRNPLFDTMFALQNPEIPSVQFNGSQVTPYRYEEDQSKFDISLIGVERSDALSFTCEYSTKLFKKETIERFILFFQEIVSAVLEDTQKKLSAISIIPGHEKRQILEEFNHPVRPYPLKTAAGLFEERLEISPSSTACFHEGNYLTFAELNKRVHIIANLIEEL